MTSFKFLCICIISLTLLSVVRSEWEYPDLSAPEGPMSSSKIYLNQIASSNAQVASYTFTGVGVTEPDYNGQTKFKIENNGKIYQINELDRERRNEYTLTASAFDSTGARVESDKDITIIVTDINDERPQFVADTLSGTVAEAASYGDVFMTVSATDADEPNTLNSQLSYELVSGSDSPPLSTGSRFSVNSLGQVSVVGNLDYETYPEVTLQVIARDGGGVVAGWATTATVTVHLTDSNDHAPVFDLDTMPAEKTLSELSGLDTPLYNIYATDADEGVNKKVYFHITSGNIGQVFKIVSQPSDTGRSLGTLQLLKPLDFESGTTSYSLSVRASNDDADNSANTDYQATSTLSIKVADANEPPVFINTPYTGIVSEDDDDPTDANGEVVPVAVVQVTAQDYDFGENQTVSYSLSDPEDWFRIDAQTGQINRVAKVDREAPVVNNGVYVLTVQAMDNYDHGSPASGNSEVSITIQDINDNPPSTGWSDEDSTVRICKTPSNDTVKKIVASDPDSNVNGPPFTFRLDSIVDNSLWGLRSVNDVSSEVISKFDEYDLSGGSEQVIIPFTITDSGSPLQTGTATLTVSVCECDDEGNPTCQDATAAGFPVAIIIAIIAILILIIILVLALVAYRRRQATQDLKVPILEDEDDVRETVQLYQEEGGEEDQDAYDLSALRGPLMEDPTQPKRIEKPLQQAPRQPRGHIPDDIGDYIGDAKDQADADPSAPPFDSLLVFDYEGMGSDAGSLSSINTATTDGSMDYDYMNNWGPRFKKLADMYNDGSESE